MIKEWMNAVPPVSKYKQVFDNRVTGERIFVTKDNTVIIDGQKPKKCSSFEEAMSYMCEHMGGNQDGKRNILPEV